MTLYLLTLQATGPTIDFGQFGAVVATAVITFLAVPVVRYFLPILKTKYEWAIPLIAALAPPLLSMAATVVSNFFGYPVDFGPLIDLFAGGALAVAGHQVYKQAKKKAA